MRPRTVLSSLSVVVVAVAVVGLPRAASDPLVCPTITGAPAAGPGSPPAEGAATAAVQGRGLVIVDEAGRSSRYRHVAGDAGLLRHAASRPGWGTAYVNDLRGPDTVVMLSGGLIVRIHAGGEATHPAIGARGALAWAEDLRLIRVRRPGGATRTLPAPRAARAVFSPAFLGPRRLVAVVEEEAGSTHDTGLDNLYRVSIRTGSWVPLTSFEATADRWSAIRTPVIGRDGTVWFVRVTGRGSATRRPAFQLWRLGPTGASMVRSLRGEAYLAGTVSGRLLWNVYDRAARSWRLLLAGDLVGCGAAMVEARSAPDPDLAAVRTATGEAPDPAVSEEGALGIVVGDFDTRAEAQEAADRIGSPAVAVGHGGAPAAVGPERFAAAVPLMAGDDPVEALDAFRERYAEYADRSWIAVLAGPEGVP